MKCGRLGGRRLRVAVALAGLVGMVLAGCGGGDSPTAPSGGGNGGELAAAAIGPGGGTLATPDSAVVVVFAPGAVAATTRFTLATADGLPQDPGYVPGTAVTLGPPGTVFAGRVTMTIRYDTADLPAGLVGGSLALCALVDGVWEPAGVAKAADGEGEAAGGIAGGGTYGVAGQVVAGDVYEGTYRVRNMAELAALLPYAGVSGDLRFWGEDLPATVELPDLRWVGGALVIEAVGCDTMRFPTLGQVDWGLGVKDCDHHVELELPVCRAVGGITLDQAALRHVDGLSALRRLNPLGLDLLGTILVQRVDSLRSLSGLSGLSGTAAGVRVYDAPVLASLSGLGGVSRVTGDVEIAHTEALTGLDGLHLVSVEGNLLVWYNSRLGSLGALQTLGEAGAIVVQANGELADLSGLGGLGTLHHLAIKDNPALVSLAGLAPLSDLTSSLIIENNPLLEDLAGLDHLQSIGENLRIAENTALEHLDELGDLVHVGGALELEANTHLLDLDGLSSLHHAWGAIRINHNLRLADVTGLHHLEANPATGYVCGSFTATYNCLDHGGCPGDVAYWDVVESFGGEDMVQYEVIIHGND